MREIKFRAWDNTLNNWVIGYLVGDYIIDLYDFETAYEDIAINTITQYIGLKDINGKEIYEGDIVEYILPFDLGKKRGVVEFEKGTYGISPDGCILYGTPAEIIGNIYENPELLKEQ